MTIGAVGEGEACELLGVVDTKALELAALDTTEEVL